MKNLFTKTIVTLLTAVIIFSSVNINAFAYWNFHYGIGTDGNITYKMLGEDTKLGNGKTSKYDGVLSFGKNTGKKARSDGSYKQFTDAVIKRTTTVYAKETKYVDGERIEVRGKKIATLYKGTTVRIWSKNGKYTIVTMSIYNTNTQNKLKGRKSLSGMVKSSNLELNESKMVNILKSVMYNNKQNGQTVNKTFPTAWNYSEVNIYSSPSFTKDDLLMNYVRNCVTGEYVIDQQRSKILEITDEYIKVKFAMVKFIKNKGVSNCKIAKTFTGYVHRNYNVAINVSVEPKVNIKAVKKAYSFYAD